MLLTPVSFMVVSSGCVAANPENDLRAENAGDYIILWWPNQRGATEYVLYRANDITGPWKEIGRVGADASLTGGGKIDQTPDARVMDLCYKLEAVDAHAQVIRTYQPICVPKYAKE